MVATGKAAAFPGCGNKGLIIEKFSENTAKGGLYEKLLRIKRGEQKL